MSLQKSYSDLEAVKDHSQHKESSRTRELTLFLTIAGTGLLFLVCLTPVWDAVVLLYSPMYVYLVGRLACELTICFCGGVILFYIMIMMILSRCGSRHMMSQLSFMYLFTSTITLLGLGFSMISRPMRLDSLDAYNELMFQCADGPRTQQLSNYYNGLLDMRLKPDCINKVSIEDCAGFEQRPPYTNLLKEMELSFECSGFCYSGNKTLPNSTVPPLSAVLVQESEVQVKGSATLAQIGEHRSHPDGVESSLETLAIRRGAAKQNRRNRQQGMALLASNDTIPPWVKLPEGMGDTGQDMIKTGWMSKYPPNLFTDANYKTTCDGAAARQMRFGALESASLLYWQGAALLLATILAGLLKLSTLCSQRKAA